MTETILGIIGGSGIYDLPGLEGVREQRIESPWGEASGALRFGAISRSPVVSLSRRHKPESSFFGKGCVAHVSMAHPVSPRLLLPLAGAAEQEGMTVARNGTY